MSNKIILKADALEGFLTEEDNRHIAQMSSLYEKTMKCFTVLEENSVTAWKTSTPTLLIHGTDDTFVPPMGTNQLFQGFLTKGVGVNKVIMLPLPGEDHQSGIIPSGLASIEWIFEIKDAAEM